MKINPFNRMEMNPYHNNKVNNVDKQPKADQSDKVEISQAAKEMQQIPHIVSERKARVEELSAQVASGKYQVDPHTLARDIANFYRK